MVTQRGYIAMHNIIWIQALVDIIGCDKVFVVVVEFPTQWQPLTFNSMKFSEIIVFCTRVTQEGTQYKIM